MVHLMVGGFFFTRGLVFALQRLSKGKIEAIVKLGHGQDAHR